MCTPSHQYPFVLAWAWTIHKIVQSLSLDKAVMKLKNPVSKGVFTHSKAYVARSGVELLEALGCVAVLCTTASIFQQNDSANHTARYHILD